MNFSVCIITKNEEQNIERCLKALVPYGTEIVVADTGSTDRTREIALQYTKQVFDFVWCDDFAAAKNFAISKATNEYVLIVDADEFLEPIEPAVLEKLCEELEKWGTAVGRVYRRNIFERNGEQKETDEWLNRIFSKNRFRYEGRIHEQVVAIDGSDYETFKTPLSFVHTGYDLTEDARRQKTQRNITLLERELERLGDENTEELPYVLYQLGKSYYMAENYPKACDYFSQGLSYDLNPKLEYVIDMVETYGYALVNARRYEEALFFENIYETFGDSADFQFLMGLIYMNNARFEDAVREFLKATNQEECRSRGTNSYAAYYNIGVIYECLGQTEDARRYYEKCGEYEPARKRIEILCEN